MQEEVVLELGCSLTVLNGVVGEVALMVVMVQMGIEDSVFEGVYVEFVTDSQSFNSSSLISKGYFVGMEVVIFVVASMNTKAKNFVELFGLVGLVRLVNDVFQNYSNKD